MGYEEHSFYCICCGNKGIPLSRSKGLKRGKFHRKKLYCIYCKTEVNHIECRDDEDIKTFKENFQNGVYIDEAVKESVYIIGNSR